MGAAVGGSVESIAIAGRIFSVAADADANRDLGGFENAVESNGDGTARLLKTRKPWAMGGLALEINDDRGDQEFLQQEIGGAHDFVEMEFTFASGVTFRGRGMVTDKIEMSSAKATAPISFSGPGNLEQ